MWNLLTIFVNKFKLSLKKLIKKNYSQKVINNFLTEFLYQKELINIMQTKIFIQVF